MSLKRLALLFLCLLCFTITTNMCMAQDTAAVAPAAVSAGTDVWRFAPENSLAIVGYDARPENPSIQILRANQDKELRAAQETALKKAVENFATLFGVSLDFAKDIEVWAENQWAVAVIAPANKNEMPVAVMLIGSKDTASADQALSKLLAPWERIGEVNISSAAGCSIRAFKAKKGKVEIYASACGPVVAVSSSEAALKAAIGAQGPAESSPASKILQSLKDSVFYAYINPAIIPQASKRVMPVVAVGMGVFILSNGYQVRLNGLPDENIVPLLNQIVPNAQAGVLMVNEAIPANPLAAAALGDLNPVLGFLGGLGNLIPAIALPGGTGGDSNSKLELASVLMDTKLSGALTAVLPLPSGVVAAQTASEEAASQKAEKIRTALKAAKMTSTPGPDIPGLKVESVAVSKDMTVLWTQTGNYLLFASDRAALAKSAASVRNEQPSALEDPLYKETICGLYNPNLLSLYLNLAPIRGAGYLMEGFGLNRFSPVHQAFIDWLEDMKGFSVGVGYDGQMVNGSMFLATKPGAPMSIGPTATLGAAVSAAVLFPVFARARRSAEQAKCADNLKEIALAAISYADEHNGVLPTRQNWRKQIEPYLGMPLLDYECSHGTIIAFNKNLGGLHINKILNPAEVVMFFEANPDLAGATGSRANAAVCPDGTYFAYVDGHVKLDKSAPAQSHWVPKYAQSKKPVKKR